MHRSPAQSMTPPEPASWWAVFAWIAGAALARTLLALGVPPFPDETYYWEWSRRLAAGYFDHPPGIALLIRLGTLGFGATIPGIRGGAAAAALLTHGAAVVAAWQLAGRGATGRRSALRAAQLVALLPIALAGLVLATPDAALFALTMLALVAVERALASPIRSGASLGWWVLAGTALGGAFLSKYTAVLLPMALVLACLIHPALRHRFAEPGPWVAGLLALALFAPVVAWNAEHDWVSFRFQLGHGLGRPPARGSAPSRVFEMLGGQVGLASPVLFGLMALAVWHALRDGWRDRRGVDPTAVPVRRFALAVVALVPLAFFALSALRKPVEANWPAMIYPSALLLLATAESPGAHGRWWRRGIIVAAALSVLVVGQALVPLLPVAPRRDPIGRAHGWDTLAAGVERATRSPFLHGATTIRLAADRYQDASALAFHLPGNPQVFSLNLGGRANQYDLWPTFAGQARPGDALIAVFDDHPAGDSLATRVGEWFTGAQRGEQIVLARAGGEITRRRIWLYRAARGVSPRRSDSTSSP